MSILTKQLAKEQNNTGNLSGSECHSEYSPLKCCICECAKRRQNWLEMGFQPLNYIAFIYMNAKHFWKHYNIIDLEESKISGNKQTNGNFENEKFYPNCRLINQI